MFHQRVFVNGLLAAVLAGVMGCASATALSPMQKRQITTKLIEGSFEDIYRATLTVLQDQDYIIENTDMTSGLIVARVRRDNSNKILGIPVDSDKVREVEVTTVVNKLNETSSEVRLSILESVYDKGAKQDAQQVYDVRVYENFFNQIMLEVKRREAMK